MMVIRGDFDQGRRQAPVVDHRTAEFSVIETGLEEWQRREDPGGFQAPLLQIGQHAMLILAEAVQFLQ